MYTAQFLINNLTGSQIAVIQMNVDNLQEPIQKPDILEPEEYQEQWIAYEKKISETKRLIRKFLEKNGGKK
jgi:hypothetical protein